MIAFLRGTLVELLPTIAVIDVQGVGYEVLIPLSSSVKLKELGKEIKLYTQLIVREDAMTLYGFVTIKEKELFSLLINSVSGIGPKMALNILSGMSIDAFQTAVASDDSKSLSMISGIGKKTAARIIVELKDKISASFSEGRVDSGNPDSGNISSTTGTSNQSLNDAVAALLTLGFKQPEALNSVRAAQTMLGPNAKTEDLIRASLKK